MPWTKASETERRRQILDAASEAAARRGLAHLTLRAVATEAGLSHGLVLFHFGSKDALLSALLDHVIEWLHAPVTPRDRRPDFWGLVDSEVAAADPDRTALLLDFWVIGARDAGLRERLRRGIEAYEAGLGRVASIGTPEDQDPAEVATSLIFGRALRSLLSASDASPRGGARDQMRLADRSATVDTEQQ